ncbi:MAG TPA: S1C family serine protease [Stellaceae bacterium]|jgi:S1-C subfamily serine protease|nr:S1C family serine protease [Stellaceae bacterium]
MSRTMDWEIPNEFQPKAEDFEFDLESKLAAVLGLQATVPEDAFTATTLGTERAGSGVLIGKNGLVLTIGYLITEAESIWLTSSVGGAVPGHVLGYDQETGFGLVQALGRLNVAPLEIGARMRVGAGDKAVLAAEGGRRHAVAATVVARQEFAGYWEYVLDRAIFTAPAHPFWGGAALIGSDGSLIGIGSLHVQHSNGRELRRDVNMVVPIDLLPPIVDDILTYGRANRPPRPWLGLYAAEVEDSIVVAGLSDRGPASKTGLKPGDRILAVRDDPISSLASFWRRVWASGPAGSEVVLQIMRDKETIKVRIPSADRSSLLKSPRLH